MIDRFWNQASPAYRNFAIAYAVLVLNFAIPAGSYLFAPHIAVDQIHDVGAMLGAPAYEVSEDSHMWRFLAVSDVAALAFMCGLLLLNLRRWYRVLLPLVFLKACSVAGSAYIGLVQYQHPFFAFPVVLDGTTCLVMWFFATRARRQIEGLADDKLVPRPRLGLVPGEDALPWTRGERRWLGTVITAMIPPLPAGEGRPAVPATELVMLQQGLGRVLRGMPWIQQVALRAALWLVMIGGPWSIGRPLRTFAGLAADDRDRVLVRLGSSDAFLIREMVVLLKLAAGFVREQDPAFRAALGWGVGRPVQVGEVAS
jgi:hypothetical protein